jgi:hypothetical protein
MVAYKKLQAWFLSLFAAHCDVSVDQSVCLRIALVSHSMVHSSHFHINLFISSSSFPSFFLSFASLLDSCLLLPLRLLILCPSSFCHRYSRTIKK